MTEREMLMEQTRDAAREVIRCKVAIKLANKLIKKNCLRIGEIDGYYNSGKLKRDSSVRSCDSTGDLFDPGCNSVVNSSETVMEVKS